MGKVGKTLIGLFAAIVLVIGIGIYLLVSNLDEIVKTVIERAGSEVTGVAVSVASVEIDLRGGAGAINGLRIDNPDGFNSDYAMQLGRAALKINLDETTGELVVLDAASSSDGKTRMMREIAARLSA